MQMENDIVRVVAVGIRLLLLLLLSFYVVGNYYMAHYKLPDQSIHCIHIKCVIMT